MVCGVQPGVVRDDLEGVAPGEAQEFEILDEVGDLEFRQAVLRVPKISPGPRRRRSSSAILKPSLVAASTSSRREAIGFRGSPTKKHVASADERPMRPRSWWKLPRPNRSACITTITLAAATSTPTSTTTDAASTLMRPEVKSCITESFCADGICPCTSPTPNAPSGPAAS